MRDSFKEAQEWMARPRRFDWGMFWARVIQASYAVLLLALAYSLLTNGFRACIGAACWK